LLGPNAVGGGEHVQLVASRGQRLHKDLAAHVVGAGVVGRVKVGQD